VTVKRDRNDYEDLFDTWRKVDPFMRPFSLLARDVLGNIPTSTGSTVGGMLTPQMQEWNPRLDVRETDNAIIVHADLPGVDKDAMNVSVQDNNLTISGERRHEKVDETERFQRVERSYGSFYRTLPLPEGIDANQVNARYDNGVLEVTIPKPMTKQQKRIRVNVTGGGANNKGGAAPAKGGK